MDATYPSLPPFARGIGGFRNSIERSGNFPMHSMLGDGNSTGPAVAACSSPPSLYTLVRPAWMRNPLSSARKGMQEDSCSRGLLRTPCRGLARYVLMGRKRVRSWRRCRSVVDAHTTKTFIWIERRWTWKWGHLDGFCLNMIRVKINSLLYEIFKEKNISNQNTKSFKCV